MNFEEKKENLLEIYDRYEDEVSGFRKDAACRAGCTFCCTFMGNVDIVTLEGLIIRERITAIPEKTRSSLLNMIKENRSEKERGGKSRCPFLDGNGLCVIYDARPFSCRQLYSVRACDSSGPVVHRQAVESAKKTVREIQELDDTGYSGHHSFILHLLDTAGFRHLYLSGGFDPGRIMKFGRSHGIIINRFAK